VILRLIILYFVSQWRKPKKAVKQEAESSNLVLVRGVDWVDRWTPVILTADGVREVEPTEVPNGVVVPYFTGNAVLTVGIHNFSGYGVPAPDGLWLGRESDTESWAWHVNKPNQVFARIFQQYIIKEDFDMGYAIGSRDVADVREYASVGGSAFGTNGPITGMPVKTDGSGLAPATALDEVIEGIVKQFSSSDGGSTYDITIQVAEGDFACATSLGGSAAAGTPLYVQAYSSDPSSFEQM
jgi:hypothetical protein